MIHHATQAPTRRPNRNPLTMAEYDGRRREFAARGQGMKHSKLLDIDVISIRSSIRQRGNLLKHIDDNLSNAALARIHGVHVRTIDKVHRGETWSHLA
jgi:hypothetical protein